LQIFRDIDKNFDGKISFEEFETWWRLGENNNMKELVYFKLKSLSLLKKAQKEANKIDLLENKYSDEESNHFKINVSCGEPIEASHGIINANFNNYRV
jgi:hypothetical protein